MVERPGLIPIPPLDGSHVMKHLLPPAWALQYQRIGRYGFLLLMVLLTVGKGLLTTWLTPVGLLTAAAQDFVAPFLLSSP